MVALAVFRHSVFAGSAQVQPFVGSVCDEAKAGRGSEETILIVVTVCRFGRGGGVECNSFGLGA